MSCIISTQKRARLTLQASPAAATSSWSSSLPQEITVKLAEHIVHDNDIDSYMAFRAVCHNWRTETTNQPGKVDDHTDPTRFQPTKWALLDKQDDRVMFVDVDTGRFLHMSIPILHNYLFVGATSGGLILLGEKEEPHQVRLLNPFTGAIAHFKARAPAEGVMAVVVTTNPLMVFVSLEDGYIICADQSSEHFNDFSVLDSGKPTPIVSFDGEVYASDPQGTIISRSTISDVPNGEKCRSEAVNWMSAAIPTPAANPEALVGSGDRYYLVQFGGDLLLVTRPLDGVLDDEPLIRRVDTKQNVIEPVSSIGSYAIFVSHVRCISIDANKFQGIKGGCIYFVEPILLLARGSYVPSIITTYQVDDGPQAGLIMSEEGMLEGCSGPLTITQVFADYCRTIHYHELYQMISNEWDWDFSDSESDNEAALWGLEEAVEFLEINYDDEE